MNSNPLFVLAVIHQLLAGLLNATAQQGPAYTPVVGNSVTVAGLQSDVQMIDNNERFNIAAIHMADPRGSVVPTTTIEAPEIQRSFIPAAPMYDVFKQPKL